MLWWRLRLFWTGWNLSGPIFQYFSYIFSYTTSIIKWYVFQSKPSSILKWSIVYLRIFDTTFRLKPLSFCKSIIIMAYLVTKTVIPYSSFQDNPTPIKTFFFCFISLIWMMSGILNNIRLRELKINLIIYWISETSETIYSKTKFSADFIVPGLIFCLRCLSIDVLIQTESKNNSYCLCKMGLLIIWYTNLTSKPVRIDYSVTTSLLLLCFIIINRVIHSCRDVVLIELDLQSVLRFGVNFSHFVLSYSNLSRTPIFEL